MQGLSRPLSTDQGRFNFQGLFKTALYIQVLFKPKEWTEAGTEEKGGRKDKPKTIGPHNFFKVGDINTTETIIVLSKW